MGKATILPSKDLNLTPGRYKVRIEKDDTRSAQEIKNINSELSILDSAISRRYSDQSNAQRVHAHAQSDLNAVIGQSKESQGDDYTERIKSATAAEQSTGSDLLSAKSSYQAARLKRQSLETKKLYLGNRITEDIRTVWCADCQTDLSGSVATIEIPNTDDTILIRPGGASGDGSNYSAPRDGQLRSVAAMSPAEAAWNYTMLPAWQKFKPLYRIGKITRRVKDNSKCDVLLDAYSTVQDLDTDVKRELKNVPMIYKDFEDGEPYVIGDRVVVEFYNQNWEAPRVVGFEEDPCIHDVVAEPPAIQGIFQLVRYTGELVKYTGWTNVILERQSNAISGIWDAACLGPDGMIAAEIQTQQKLYQFSGVSTVVDSIIGNLASTDINDLYYDSTTGNLISTESKISGKGHNLNIHNGISTAISSTMTFPYADAFSGAVYIAGACVYSDDLVLSVYWFSIAENVNKAQLWRMVGYSTTVRSVLADYSGIWPAALAHPFTYTGGFAFHIYGGNIMIKYEISPSGPGVVITDFDPNFPGSQYIGGGYVE